MITFEDISSVVNLLTHLEIELPKEEKTAYACVLFEQVSSDTTKIVVREKGGGLFVRYLKQTTTAGRGEIGTKFLALYKELVSALTILKAANTKMLTVNVEKGRLILRSDVYYNGIDYVYNHKRSVRLYAGDIADFDIDEPDTPNLYFTTTQKALEELFTVINLFCLEVKKTNTIMFKPNKGQIDVLGIGLDRASYLLYTLKGEAHLDDPIFLKGKDIEKLTKLTTELGLVEIYISDTWISGLAVNLNKSYFKLQNRINCGSLETYYTKIEEILNTTVVYDDLEEDEETDKLILCGERVTKVGLLSNTVKAQQAYTTEITTELMVFDDEDNESLLVCHRANVPTLPNEETGNDSRARYDITLSSGYWFVIGFYYKSIQAVCSVLWKLVGFNDSEIAYKGFVSLKQYTKGTKQWVVVSQLYDNDSVKIITLAQDGKELLKY
jgi:hypothetical protein